MPIRAFLVLECSHVIYHVEMFAPPVQQASRRDSKCERSLLNSADGFGIEVSALKARNPRHAKGFSWHLDQFLRFALYLSSFPEDISIQDIKVRQWFGGAGLNWHVGLIGHTGSSLSLLLDLVDGALRNVDRRDLENLRSEVLKAAV